MSREDELVSPLTSPVVRIPGRAAAMMRNGQVETEAVLLVPVEVSTLEFATGDDVVEQLRVGLLHS